LQERERSAVRSGTVFVFDEKESGNWKKKKKKKKKKNKDKKKLYLQNICIK
jgi:hypothetical protein